MTKSFYNEDKLKLPLDSILLQRAYFYKKEKCSKNFLSMSNENNDNIIITRNAKGHYLYFNPNDDKDKGNIFSFCKNRGLSVNELLNKENLKNLEVKHSLKPFDSEKHLRIDEFKAFSPLKEKNLFTEKRLINKALLQEFHTIKEDKYHNICIPSFSPKNLNKSQITQHAQEAQNKKIIDISQSGYVAYLASPLKKDKEGKELKNHLKSLCYGNKGLEILKHPQSKMSDIKYIIISESMIDSLSFFELQTNEQTKDQANQTQAKQIPTPQNTLLCSSNGQISKNQKEIINYLATKIQEAKFILAFDNDTKGQGFNKELSQILQNSLKKEQIEIIKPCLKDFNDDLITAKFLRLEKHLSPQNIEKQINSFFKKQKDFISKQRLYNEIDFSKHLQNLNTKAKIFSFLEPKIHNYISSHHQDILQNSLSEQKKLQEKHIKTKERQ